MRGPPLVTTLRTGFVDVVHAPHTRPMRNFPDNGMELTHVLVVEDLDRAREFYRDVLGADIQREYGGSSTIMRFLGSWLLLVMPGEPTDDRPDITLEPPADLDRVSHTMTIRVPDCRSAYTTLRDRGAVFLTPPVTTPREVRACFRDPDGHLIEISEAR